jgi:sulfite exporter TauE/SafE
LSDRSQRSRIAGWVDLVRSLGGSLIEVLKAEVDALKEELAVSGRHLAVGAALVGGAAVLLFWTVGALIFALGAVLAIWLQTWAAALIVVGIFLLAAVLLLLLARSQFRKFQNPMASLREHLEDHLDWWQHTLLREEKRVEPPPAAAEYRRDWQDRKETP